LRHPSHTENTTLTPFRSFPARLPGTAQPGTVPATFVVEAARGAAATRGVG